MQNKNGLYEETASNPEREPMFINGRLVPLVRPLLKDLKDVKQTERRWIFPGWVPLGAVSMMTGDPGIGKTQALLDLATTKAEGGIWPDGSVATPSRVLYLDGENGEEELKRRLVAHGFDSWDNFRVMSEVHAGYGPAPFDVSVHMPALKEAVATYKPAWVIVDPLIAFHTKDENKAAEARHLMMGFAKLAEENSIGVTLLQHPNKSPDFKDLYKVRGSIDLVASSRALFTIHADDLNPKVRVMRMIKLNLGPMPDPLAFQLVEGAVDWMGPWTAGVAPLSQLQRAVEQLRLILACGPEEATALLQALQMEGISKRTAHRAKKQAGLVSEKEGSSGPWLWRLPSPPGIP